MVPPVMNSTATPVSCVNFLAAVSATRSRQLPPQMLTTSLSCAAAGSESSTKPRAMAKIEMRGMRQPPGLQTGRGALYGIGEGRVDEIVGLPGGARGPADPRFRALHGCLALALQAALCLANRKANDDRYTDMLPDMLIGAAFKERLRQGSTRF